MSVVTATLNPCIDKTFSVKRMIPERKLAGSAPVEYPGGGGINVARVLTRLGVDGLALWSRGGVTGRKLGQLLDAEQVPHRPVSIEQAVRENLIIRDDSTGQQYRFGMPGPTLSATDREAWMGALRDRAPSTRYVVFSGSLPGGTSADWYERLLAAAPSDARLIVDTKQQALRRALRHGVFLIKPNINELEELVERELPDDAAIERACRDIIASGGAEVVVVSLGRGGAILITREAVERFVAPSVRLCSKVGAGDSMVGGIVAALAQDRGLSEAVTLGVAAGAAAVMTEGTELCHREDVERLYASVQRQNGRADRTA